MIFASILERLALALTPLEALGLASNQLPLFKKEKDHDGQADRIEHDHLSYGLQCLCHLFASFVGEAVSPISRWPIVRRIVGQYCLGVADRFAMPAPERACRKGQCTKITRC